MSSRKVEKSHYYTSFVTAKKAHKTVLFRLLAELKKHWSHNFFLGIKDISLRRRRHSFLPRGKETRDEALITSA